MFGYNEPTKIQIWKWTRISENNIDRSCNEQVDVYEQATVLLTEWNLEVGGDEVLNMFGDNDPIKIQILNRTRILDKNSGRSRNV